MADRQTETAHAIVIAQGAATSGRLTVILRVVTSLAWRSLLLLSLPFAVGACPSTEPIDVDTTGPASTGDESTSTGPATTKGEDSTSTGVVDSSSSSTAAPTTDPSTSSGVVDDSTGEVAVCNNNVIEGDEVCDLSQVNGETCQSLGYQGGQLGCLLTCTDYNLLGCFICGNEVIDIAEDCEGEFVPEDVTCQSMGYEAGTVTCGTDCLYDVSDCSICGDGIQAGPEQCDGIDFDGQTCASIGFDEGNLACNLASCTFNVSGCSGGQYIQDFEAGVMPPEFTQGGNLPWVVDNNVPIAGGFSAHSGAITHNQTSSMSITANFAAAGNITFSHRESTEACCDFLRFFMDGAQVMQWSGNTMVVGNQNTPVAAGMHTFEWRYVKDGSVNTGSDRVWVDNINLTPGVPI